MVVREGHAHQVVGRLYHGRRQSHLNVPLDVAVEQPDAWVGGTESQDDIGVRHDGDCVAHRRVVLVVFIAAWPGACSAVGTGEDLEVVAMEVEGVVGDIIVVDHDLDCVVVVDHKRVHLAVDDRVATGVSGGGGAVEGRDLLVNVGEVVEARAILSVSTSETKGSRLAGTYRGYPFLSRQNLKSSLISVWYGSKIEPPS